MTGITMDKYDKLLRNRYLGDELFGIPKLHIQDLDEKEFVFMGFDHVSNKKHRDEDKTIHFFLDDSKFERVYLYPEKYIERLAKYRALLTPDFSVYEDMPLALQINSVFKNRWCGAYWQEYGLKVIPTISWSDERSLSFCFNGIEKHSIVAVSTLGSKKVKKKFMYGYDAMLEQIEPSVILCYDKPFKEMKGNVKFIDYLQATGRCCA
ncbi:MAG: DUF4417 domain-containing protein [Lachnospiraceae bacterium]|nr:DUF4417 domain-containing protein [Lachnospiraceae bacterium]